MVSIVLKCGLCYGQADFDSAHKNNERMIVGFTALWNGPSKTIAPKFQVKYIY